MIVVIKLSIWTTTLRCPLQETNIGISNHTGLEPTNNLFKALRKFLIGKRLANTMANMYTWKYKPFPSLSDLCEHLPWLVVVQLSSQ